MQLDNVATVRKTVLFVAVDSQGHINSLRGAANYLRRRGHRTVFLFHDPIDSGLLKEGHEVYDCTSEQLVPSDVVEARKINKFDRVFGQLEEQLKNPTADNQCEWLKSTFDFFTEAMKRKEPLFKRKLELIKPDVLIVDQYHVQPAIQSCGKPWALVFSMAPLTLHPRQHNLPPALLGLPTNYMQIEDVALRNEYHSMAARGHQIKEETSSNWRQYLADEHGLSPNPNSVIDESPYLNLYMCPKELDYEQPLANWLQCDSILRSNCQIDDIDTSAAHKQLDSKPTFEIPAELRDKPGKLIFLSMGTLACSNVTLMKRLVEILSKSPHRFIVSRGPYWNKYELAANMWGQAHVDQLAILPNIDLIITHGGNNTITECFYYGVPGFIVCPAFGDQKDNAQRIEECKLGRRLNPFSCSEGDFLRAIEEILSDESIRARMSAIRDRMQKPESKFKALRLFRDFVEQNTC